MDSSNSLAPAGSACSRERLNRYVAGTLGADALLEFLFHVDGCPKCWQTLYEIRRAADRRLYKRQSGVAIPDPTNYASAGPAKPNLVVLDQAHPPALTAIPSHEHNPEVLEEVHIEPPVFGATTTLTLEDVPIAELKEVAPPELPDGAEVTFKFPDGVAREVASTPTRKRPMKNLEPVEDDVIIRRLEEEIASKCEELDRLEKAFSACETEKHALEVDLEALRRSAEVRKRYLEPPVSFRKAKQKITKRAPGAKIPGGKWTEPILDALEAGSLTTPEVCDKLREFFPDLVDRVLIYQALCRMRDKGLVKITGRRGEDTRAPYVWELVQAKEAQTA